jgi:TatD DNase family protein
MLIDSHAHLDDYEDLDQVLARARAENIAAILAIGIGEGPGTMHQALAIAKAHTGNPALYASVGIHPQEAHQATPEALADLKRIAEDPRVIAIGEIGLDYYHANNPDLPTQQAAFLAQLAIASELKKPILIHCRTSELAKPEAKQKFGDADAWEDLLTLLAAHGPAANGGIMHCFSGTIDHAHRSLAAGFYLSFAGNLTYPKSDAIRQAAATAPADRILVETDAPFLAPIPYRGQRNEPALVTHTAALLATLRGLTPEALAALTTQNFHTLFPVLPDGPPARGAVTS